MSIHDWHAEILAIRAFNRFVLEECKRLALQGDNVPQSEFICRRRTVDHDESEQQGTTDVWKGQPFAWREDVSLHMYCSEAPCMCAHFNNRFVTIDESSQPDQSKMTDTPTRRRRRKHGTNHGRPRRRLALGDPLPNTRRSANRNSNPRTNRRQQPPSRPRLLLPTWHRPPQALARRRPAQFIQVLLRQARHEAGDLASLLSHQHSGFAYQSIPVQHRVARISILRCGMQEVFLFFYC